MNHTQNLPIEVRPRLTDLAGCRSLETDRSLDTGFSPGLIFGTFGGPMVLRFFVIVPYCFGASFNNSGSIWGISFTLGPAFDLFGFSKVAVEGRGRSILPLFGVWFALASPDSHTPKSTVSFPSWRSGEPEKYREGTLVGIGDGAMTLESSPIEGILSRPGVLRLKIHLNHNF